MNAVPAPASATGALAPIVVELVVACPPDRAFDYFTRDIGRWWPLDSHSVGLAQSESVRFEPHVGGRLVETLADGSESAWGTVEAWHPGSMLRFTWHPGRESGTAQWVEVTFAGHAAGTRITLTHGGWERLGERAAQARANYVGGWRLVLVDRYGSFASAPSAR